MTNLPKATYAASMTAIFLIAVAVIVTVMLSCEESRVIDSSALPDDTVEPPVCELALFCHGLPSQTLWIYGDWNSNVVYQVCYYTSSDTVEHVLSDSIVMVGTDSPVFEWSNDTIPTVTWSTHDPPRLTIDCRSGGLSIQSLRVSVRRDGAFGTHSDCTLGPIRGKSWWGIWNPSIAPSGHDSGRNSRPDFSWDPHDSAASYVLWLNKYGEPQGNLWTDGTTDTFATWDDTTGLTYSVSARPDTLPSGVYRWRVYAIDSSGCYLANERATFVVKETATCQINVDSPAAGDFLFGSGFTLDVEWTCDGECGDWVEVTLLRDTVRYWSWITANDGKFDDYREADGYPLESDLYNVKVEDLTSGCVGYSEYFAIVGSPPCLMHGVRPSQGEVLRKGSDYTVSWQNVNSCDWIHHVTLWKGGASWRDGTRIKTLAQFIPNTGSFDWIVDDYEHGSGSDYWISVVGDYGEATGSHFTIDTMEP